MPDALKLGFGPFAAPAKGVLVVFCDDGLKFGPATAKALAPAAGLVARAAKAERFTGKSGAALELIVPEGLKVARLVVVGVGKAGRSDAEGFRQARRHGHGQAAGRRRRGHDLRRTAGRRHERAEQAADLAQGVRLRAYAFDRYKTKRKDDDEHAGKPQASPSRAADVAAARKAYAAREAVADGVVTGARPGQRAGQRPLPGRIRPPRRRR